MNTETYDNLVEAFDQGGYEQYHAEYLSKPPLILRHPHNGDVVVILADRTGGLVCPSEEVYVFRSSILDRGVRPHPVSGTIGIEEALVIPELL